MGNRKIVWYFNRFKAMSINEIIWRLNQKILEKKEKRLYGENSLEVINAVINKELIVNLYGCFNSKNMNINLLNTKYSLNNNLWLFGKYNYSELKKNWSYGFNTSNLWGKEFSYDLSFKQNDSIGDARTNWEINRHFQFCILAKNYYVTGDKKYLDELKDLFYDWNKNNLFLRGISWTSPMEVSIRSYSWMITLVFLKEAKIADEGILHDLEIGIINMVDYTNKHHSRYSSANNHLIVEMAILGVAGIMFNYNEWYNKAINILDKEIFIQNYDDGVNKEQALHYQAFVMEALSIFMLIMRRNSIKYPDSWNDLLANMSEFIAYNMDSKLNVSHLGDDDNGKILDLCGEQLNYYQYVLQFTSILLGKQYIELNNLHENINWLFTEDEISNVTDYYDKSLSRCFKEGGYTIMKNLQSYNNEVLLVIDHAELGFGSIAAHGHADSLSFTLNINGKKVFIDPGTYIYNIDLESRNYFRQTINHNTICIDNKNQSEMLGAFLWGKKAKTVLENYEISDDEEKLVASHNGYSPTIHRREFIYNRKNNIKIIDKIASTDKFNWTSTLIIDPAIEIIDINKNLATIRSNDDIINIEVNDEFDINIEDVWVSEVYNNKVKSKALRISANSDKKLVLNTEITIN